MKEDKQIEAMFLKHNGVMRTKELSEAGIHYRILQRLEESGKIEKIRYGYYQWQDDRAFSEVSAIVSLFPDGIFCMDTALLYYDYSDRTPSAWHIAVDNRTGRSRFHINYPEIKPHFTKEERLSIGATEGKIDGIVVRIYDRERVICDCLRHVNRMDGEIFNMVIRRYIHDSEKNVPRLMEYARRLGVEKKVRGTVGIWL